MSLKKSLLLLFILAFLLSRALVAQTLFHPGESPIEDNSFLIEEAFNQEKNVIQHINTFSRNWDNKGWLYTFTQEWPFPGHERHQLSFTIPAVESADAASGAGIGDVALNYRYQLYGGGGKRFSFSPRLSVLIPTGSVRAGRGTGGMGLQTNLPISLYINHKLVTHWNVGATIVPSARNDVGARAAVNGYNLGQSTIWLLRPRFNLMLETTWTGSQAVIGAGQTQRYHDLLLAPGIRWAHNFKNGLQVVPGISVPIGVGPGAGERAISFYLSFEHPVRPAGTK